MDAVVVIDSGARRWLEREWTKALGERGETARRVAADECPLAHLLPDLLRLADASHDRSVEDLEMTIRRIILESVFTDSNGDTIDDLADPEVLDLLVQVVVRTLHRLREEAVQRGSWSQEMAAIPMCG